MSLQRGINLRALAEKMGQCSGAEVRGICTEAGMYALRERRQHVTQEDFEFAVAKVNALMFQLSSYLITVLVFPVGAEKEPRGKYIGQQAFLIDACASCCTSLCVSIFFSLILRTIKSETVCDPFDHIFRLPFYDCDL